MCKTTKGTQAAANGGVINVPPNTVPGGNGGPGPGVDPETSTDQPIFGLPDYAPQLTLIAQASPTDNGFIALANQFHQNSGLNPVTISSIEEVVDILDDSTRSGTGVINRLRIVSHVFFDSSGLQQPINMMLPFLSGGVRPALKRHFTGFAGTRINALKAMMTFEVNTFTNTTHFIYRDPASTIISYLRPAQNTILNLVPTDALGEPTGEFNDFFLICGSKWALAENAITSSSQTSTINQAYDILLEDIISRLRNTVSEPQLQTLVAASTGLGSNHVLNFQTPHNPANYAQNLSAAITAINGNAFQTKLNRVRARFNQNSKIDIRGCQVGRDTEFLQAIQSFFGTSQTVRPAVSGPRWFQHFNPIGNITGLNSNARVVTLNNTGFSPYSATQVTQALNSWCTGFGITDAHLTFWRQTFSLDVFAFCALGWKTSIPATRIPVTRLQAINSASFAELFGKLASIFLVTAANTPTAANITSVNASLSNVGTWSAQLNATIESTATQPQLTAHFNNFKTIYEGVDDRFTGTSSPTTGQRIIPATAPASLTPAVIRDFQTALKTFIDTHARSRFRPFKRFINAALTNTQDGPAKMRYFLCLGLPFLLYDPLANNSNVNIIIAYQDGAAVTNRRQNEAIKYWIRSQWRGIIPANLGDGTTFDGSRQTPWLVENHQPGANLTLAPFVVSPTNEFQDKIVSITP